MKINERLAMPVLAATVAMVATVIVPATAADAADQAGDQVTATVRDQDAVYGSQLMTPDERMSYRSAMRAASTPAEREQIRLAHHQQMVIRARNQGVTLPDTPSSRRGGQGAGPGGGAGYGRGAAAGGWSGSGAGRQNGGAR